MAIPAILCWQGGKRSLVKELLRRMPPHRTYVEPFFGAGHLFFAKEPSEVEVINDIDPFLMSFYKKFRDMPSFDCDMTPDKARWERIKEQKEKRQALSACDYLYLVKLSHGCSLKQFGQKHILAGDCDSHPRSCLVTFLDRDFPKYKARLTLAIIKAEDWAAVVSQYDSPTTFYYLDPPYWKQDCLYSECSTNPTSVAAVVEGLKGKWLLSYNAHEDVTDAFRRYHIELVEARVTLQSGSVTAPNVLVRNYDG